MNQGGTALSVKKSTTDRVYRPRRGPRRVEAAGLTLLRGGVGVLQAVAPEATARAVAPLFFRTRRRPGRSVAIMESAARGELRFGEDRLATYAWGCGPTVLLAHGWNGRATQLAPLVEPLLSSGLRVLAFDHVGHGESTGRATSLPQMARATAAVAAASGGVYAIVGHSMGAAASVVAMHEGLDASRLALIASPSTPLPWLDVFRARLGLNDAAFGSARRRIEEKAGRPLEELVLTDLAPDLDARALIVHDRSDRQVPVASAQAIHAAWPGSRLLLTEGLGHNRLLRAPSIIEEVRRFVVER